MADNPLVSIIIPVYNAEKYLPQCLDSLLQQELTAWEAVVVDDGSSDNSFALLEEYQQLDSRFKVFRLENGSPGGEGFPVNFALDRARGKYLARVDADDWIKADMLSKMVTALEESDADIAVGRYHLYVNNSIQRERGQQASWVKFAGRRTAAVLLPPFTELLLHLGPVSCRNLYRRNLIEDNRIRYPEGDFRSQDHGFHWLTIVNASKIVLVNDFFYIYRQQVAGQLSSAATATIIASYNQVSDWLIEQLRHRGLYCSYGQLLMLDRIRQVVGLARRQQPAIAKKTITNLSRSIVNMQQGYLLEKKKITVSAKTIYWHWLKICLNRQRPQLWLVDNWLIRFLFNGRTALTTLAQFSKRIRH